MHRWRNIILNAAFFLNVLLVFFWIFEDKLLQLPPWMQVTGRFHPMILHFPIVLLIVIASFEWMFSRKEKDGTWNEKMELLISITAFSASASALVGLLLYHSGEYQEGTTIQLHKWLGIAIALISGCLVWLRRKQKVLYQSVLIFGVIITILAGHFGASITHGENYITQPLQSPPSKIQDLGKANGFVDVIQPILNEKCVGCHNPNKSKGDLLLTSRMDILNGGKDGEVIVPGSPDSSMLYRNLFLPMNDDKHMPPDGKPQLDEEEIKLLHWWISAGADFESTIATLNPPDSIYSIIKNKYGTGSPLDALDISFAGLKKINSFNNQKRGVRQLSLEKPYISVFLANRKDISAKEIHELAPLKEQVISIDLGNSNITDEHLNIITGFPHLQKLYIENTGVTDEGIRSLKKLSYLEYLNLSYTNISNKVLEYLKEFPSLRKVFFYQTNIPVSSINAYKTANPGIMVGFTPDLSSDTAFAGKLTEPTIIVDSNLFVNFATVEIEYKLKGVNIHYTTDSKDPDSTSAVYREPLLIDSSCELKTIAIRKGWNKSEIKSYSFFRAKHRFKKATLNPSPDKRYKARMDTTLIDFEKGSESHGDGKYIGYEGNDVTIGLFLTEKKVVSSLVVGYLINHNSYILAPAKIEIWGTSENNASMKKLASFSNVETKLKAGATPASMKVIFPKQEVLSLKVKITNAKKLPKWHTNAGQKSWIFLDEILVN